MRKYEIYIANLNPKKGHVQAGKRPVIVVQNDLFNEQSSTILVAPLTSTVRKIFPTEFFIVPSKQNGLSTKSRFLGNQLLTVDRRFLHKKLGALEKKYHPLVREACSIALDLDDVYLKA
jgi:mRNA interferase MazF